MRSPLTDDEFEDFLQQQVNDHRMYPSDKLWRNIQTTVHGETRWPALTYISIFIIASLVASTLLVKPEERMIKTAAAYATNAETSATGQSSITSTSNINNTNEVEASPLQKSYTDAITQQTIAEVNNKITEDQLNNTLPLASHIATTIKAEPVVLVVLNLPETKHTNTIVENADKVASSVVVKNEEPLVQGKPASKHFNTFGLMDLPAFRIYNAAYHTTSLNSEEIWRNYPPLNAKEIIKKKLSKFNFQFYLTPSVSYRRLTDANGKTAKPYTAIPASADYQLDLGQVVKHTPSIGAEVGFALGYKLTDKLTVKGGLQFNVRQYNIEAYTLQQNNNLPPLQELTNIATPVVVDSITSAYSTSYNYAQTTSKPIVLRNRYYEIATPVGVDWKLYTGNNGNLTINIAATLQPTYTFDKEPFAVTTDYKNYADGASIMRNWNLNSSLEAYISYKMGALTWQVGPQFRYQHLPTYFNYPIREHLLDYGLKIGFTKALD